MSDMMFRIAAISLIFSLALVREVSAELKHHPRHHHSFGGNQHKHVAGHPQHHQEQHASGHHQFKLRGLHRHSDEHRHHVLPQTREVLKSHRNRHKLNHTRAVLCRLRGGNHGNGVESGSQMPTADVAQAIMVDPCAEDVATAEEIAHLEEESEELSHGAEEAVKDAEDAAEAVTKEEEAIKAEEGSNSDAEAAAQNTEQKEEVVEEQKEEISEDYKEAQDEQAEAASTGDFEEAEEAKEAYEEVEEEVIEEEIAEKKEEIAKDEQAVVNAEATVDEAQEAEAAAEVKTDEKIAEQAESIADPAVVSTGEEEVLELEEKVEAYAPAGTVVAQDVVTSTLTINMDLSGTSLEAAAQSLKASLSTALGVSPADIKSVQITSAGPGAALLQARGGQTAPSYTVEYSVVVPSGAAPGALAEQMSAMGSGGSSVQSSFNDAMAAQNIQASPPVVSSPPRSFTTTVVTDAAVEDQVEKMDEAVQNFEEAEEENEEAEEILEETDQEQEGVEDRQAASEDHASEIEASAGTVATLAENVEEPPCAPTGDAPVQEPEPM
eukprot:gnl/TRDRNA2_/TRDRNA2_176503_c2_seq6.p1 gnl/TRDRNA2_/TRDRNA2_176503_c2~~gnl/TRDRNA2_/TRDRNA2_176503_c2_seq6.p1  ORF type:complete len:551 (+),score=169.57 gnl/TRDRNA2_/TRDRNA2_176503_c2_seq6:55-1707(+)